LVFRGVSGRIWACHGSSDHYVDDLEGDWSVRITEPAKEST
jgi:hypothetical protein